MQSRYLPNLSKIGSNPHPAESPDSFMGQKTFRHISNNIVRLPSIRELFGEQDEPDCSSMSRKASHGSASSSERSTYTLSRSTSPMNSCLNSPRGSSRLLKNATATTRLFQPYQPTRLPVKNEPRCPACLELGESVFLDVNKLCSQCGHKDHGHKPAGKFPRRKRTDRDQYSRLTRDNTKSIRFPKGDTEAGRRYDQSYLLACIQNEMLQMNRDLPDVAAPGELVEQIGWTHLKSPNISEDVVKLGVTPLLFNKLNIMESSLQIHRDARMILHDCQSNREALEDEIYALLHSDVSIEDMRHFLNQILEQDFATKIAASRARLGANTFESPLQLQVKL